MLTPVVSQFGAGAATLIARSPEPIGPDTQSPLAPGDYIELEPDGTLSAFGRDLSRGCADAVLCRLVTVVPRSAARSRHVFPSETLPVSPVVADTRAAWIGPAPDGSGVQLRVEAAALAGRPVYFKIVAPWTTAREAAPTPIQTVLFTVLCFVLIVVGAVLARRNLQLGSSDQRGAIRVAATIGAVFLQRRCCGRITSGAAKRRS